SAARREEKLRKRAQDDRALERDVPLLEIFDIAGDAIFDVGIIARFAAEPAHLRKTGDTRFDERAQVIILQQTRKLSVVLDEMRTRAHDAHVAAEHIPKLRHFVDAKLTKQSAERVNPVVFRACLARQLTSIRSHGAKFVDFELSILHASAALHMKQRTRRLQSLRKEHEDGEDRKNENHDRHGNGEVDRAFEKTIERIFERLLA